MANEVAQLAVSLDASGVSSGAAGAAASLEQLKAKFQSSSNEVRALQATMASMQRGGAAIDIEAYKSLRDQLTASKAAASSAAQEYIKAGGSASELMSKTTEASSALKTQADAARQAEGQLKAVAAAQKAAAASAAAYAAAVDKNVMSQKVQLPSLDGVNKAREAMISASKPAETLAKAVSGGADKAKSLMNVTKASSQAFGPYLEKLNLVKEAFSGGGGWYAAVGIATIAVLALSAAVVLSIAKLAMLAVELNKDAMEKLGKSTKTAKENFAKLFSGVHVEKFVKGVEDVLGLLDENTASAKALKAMLSTLLNPLFDAASYIAPFVRNIFRGMVIGALLAAIGILTLKKALLSLIPPEVIAAAKSLASQINWVWVAVGVGIAIVAALVVVLAALSIVLGVVAAAMFVASLPLMIVIGLLLLLVAIPLAVVAGIVLLITYFDQVKAALLEFASAGATAASGLIDGLVQGITSGASNVLAAVVGLAGSAKSALMGALGIASPSKVFAGLGKHTAAGFAEGVDAGAQGVDAAVTAMVSVPASPQGAAKGSGSGDTTIHVQIVGVKDAAEMDTDSFARRVAAAVEAALDSGGVPIPEPA